MWTIYSLKISTKSILIYKDKFQFIYQNSVECWCDLGANLVQHFIGRYSRYRTKTHDKSTISHVFPRYSRYQTVLLKLKEIISTFGRNLQKTLCKSRVFFVISWMNWGAMNCPRGVNWLTPWIAPLVHELPTALKEQGNSIHEIADFKSWSRKASIHDGLPSIHLQRIQSQDGWINRAYLGMIKKGGSTLCCAVLFTFCRFYGII